MHEIYLFIFIVVCCKLHKSLVNAKNSRAKFNLEQFDRHNEQFQCIRLVVSLSPNSCSSSLIVGLTDKSNATLDPVRGLLFSVEQQRHHIIGRVSRCGEYATSFGRLVDGTFIPCTLK